MNSLFIVRPKRSSCSNYFASHALYQRNSKCRQSRAVARAIRGAQIESSYAGFKRVFEIGIQLWLFELRIVYLKRVSNKGSKCKKTSSNFEKYFCFWNRTYPLFIRSFDFIEVRLSHFEESIGELIQVLPCRCGIYVAMGGFIFQNLLSGRIVQRQQQRAESPVFQSLMKCNVLFIINTISDRVFLL